MRDEARKTYLLSNYLVLVVGIVGQEREGLDNLCQTFQTLSHVLKGANSGIILNLRRRLLRGFLLLHAACI